MISSKIIADSIGPNGVRLTTFVLTYPRFIHSEFMTHRMISKNSASSRAIPCKKMRSMVMSDPAMPVSFSANKAGMQADGDVSPIKQKLATLLWRASGIVACGFHYALEKLGVHKQHANRILEPWLHMTVIATATDWINLFALRCHPMAQPEFQDLALKMLDCYQKSNPRELKAGEWHLPFVDQQELLEMPDGIGPEVWWPLKVSVARCARVSFLNHEGKKSTLDKDSELYDRLLGSRPIHASPAEHQAKASDSLKYSGNFKGWIQHRKLLQGENVTKLNLKRPKV